MTISVQKTSQILVDAHVHIHDCFDLEQLLDSALVNFDQVSKPELENCTSVLLTADIGNHTWLDHVNEKSLETNQTLNVNASERWLLCKTQEPYSYKVCNCDGRSIFIILGRQIVTEEGIEVLALITEKNFADHLPLEKTLRSIVNSGGLPVLPWGVGKWMGKRGAIIQNLLESEHITPLFLGDNSGRPIFWPKPPNFRQAEEKGMKILPGTDALPLKDEHSYVGSFGFKLLGSLSEDCPGESLKALLIDSSIEPYGKLASPLRFFQNQLMLRLRSM